MKNLELDPSGQEIEPKSGMELLSPVESCEWSLSIVTSEDLIKTLKRHPISSWNDKIDSLR